MEAAAAVGVPQAAGAAGAAVGGGSAAVTDEPFNEPAIEFLKRLPGITEANYR